MNIEDVLFPGNGQLYAGGEVLSSSVVDAELDEIKAVFNNDLCVELDVSSYKYITLSVENLENLINLIYQAEALYNSEK